MEGFNFSLKLNNKTILGRTEDNLSIEALVKESLTKDDAGQTKKKVVAHNVSISVSALCELNASGETTKLDRDDVIALALKTGSDAEIPVVYACTGGDSYNGTGIITSYSESSNASATDDAGISLSLDIMNFAKAS